MLPFAGFECARKKRNPLSLKMFKMHRNLCRHDHSLDGKRSTSSEWLAAFAVNILLRISEFLLKNAVADTRRCFKRLRE